MTNNIRKNIIGLLKSYPVLKARLAALQYELKNLAKTCPDEQLIAMSFRSSLDGPGTSGGAPSDRTFNIAANYRQLADHFNRAASESIIAELEPLKDTLDRFEFYVDLLPEDQRRVIRERYFGRRKLSEVAKGMLVSESTVKRYRDEAVNSLVEMYLPLSEAGVALRWVDDLKMGCF